MTKNLLLLAPLLFILLTTILTGGESVCPLGSAESGATLVAHGKIVHGPHDLLLYVDGCDAAVVLEYRTARSTESTSECAYSDQMVCEFVTYVTARYRKRGCIQCSMYDITATFSGPLSVEAIPPGFQKDALGFLHDAEGKVIGPTGFGHPNRPYSYKLDLESVSELVATKLPKP